MRFMVMHKVDGKMEAGERPSRRIIEEMGMLVRESLASGVFENGAGLHRSARRARLVVTDGRRTVTHGPLSGGNELVAACHMISSGSLDEAIEQAARLAGAAGGDGDVEIEIGPVVEPWDLGLVPAPAGPGPGRFLLLRKADGRSERAAAAPPEEPEVPATAERALKEQGVLLLAEKLAPSASGARLPAGPRVKRAWLDGPFAESKELIAGFSILNLPSKAAALKWADRYAEILDGNEVDVRELLDRRGA